MTNFGLFAAMCLVWGLTWAAITVGLDAGMPPILLAAMRYLLTALLLAGFVGGLRHAFGEGRARRVVVSALLVNAGTYGLIFWGMQSVPSGLSGLVNLALIPILLFALAAATGEEKPTLRHALALGIGCAGLIALFWTRLGEDGATSVPGLAAIVAGTACYCVGSVVARPLIGPVRPLTLTAVQAGIGGTTLLLAAFAMGETGELDVGALSFPEVAASLLFLVLLGTIFAYTVYLRLLRAWGTARAGLYAFVSPIVALVVGAYAFDETIGPVEIAGTVTLLVAAAIAISGRASTREESAR